MSQVPSQGWLTDDFGMKLHIQQPPWVRASSAGSHEVALTGIPVWKTDDDVAQSAGEVNPKDSSSL